MTRRSTPAKSAAPLASDAMQDAAAGVKSAVRVMQVFEFFDKLQRDARVSELVEYLGFPQSSTSALLKSLVQTGYLEYLPSTRSYIPTPRVALLGSWIGGSPIRDGSVGRLMDELSAETGETIVLACSNGIYAKYIHVVEATNLMRMHVPIGSQRFLAWSAVGIPLIGDMSDDEIRLLVKRTNAETPSRHKAVDVNQTLAYVEQFRKRGYFFSPGLVTPGAGMICMRLPANASTSDRPLAIGIGGLRETIEKQQARFARLLRDAIARYIGPEPVKPAPGKKR